MTDKNSPNGSCSSNSSNNSTSEEEFTGAVADSHNPQFKKEDEEVCNQD